MLLLIKIILFLACLVTAYELLVYLNENKLVNNTAIKIFNVTEGRYKKRKLIKQKLMLEEGNIKDDSFINKLDLLIEHSAIKKYIKFVNTEMYIAINIIILCLGFIVGNLTSYWLIGLLIGIGIDLFIYTTMYIFSGINYEKIEGEVIKLANTMENYADTSDDIVTIMGKASIHLKEPLKTYIENFHDEAISTGDTVKAFRNLELRVHSERVRDLIRNLEICSRHQANYREIIEDKRDSLKADLKAKQERKAIIQNGRLELSMCLVMSTVMVLILSKFMPNIITNLTSSPVGIGILIYCIIVVVSSLWSMINFDKEV